MTFTADGKMTREPLAESGHENSGTWKLNAKGFCTTWQHSGSPESIVDPNDANEQRALFNKIKTAPAAAFLPKEGWLARLISGTRSVPEPALKDMLAAYDAAKKKAEQITP
jgi:hypothetical protein